MKHLAKLLARKPETIRILDRQRYEGTERIGQINDCDSFRPVVESRDERRRMIDCPFGRRYVSSGRENERGR